MATKTPSHHISQNIEYHHYVFGEACRFGALAAKNFTTRQFLFLFPELIH